MRTVFGATQHYDWGDTTALPRLLHLPPDGKPWAEIWFGTHPIAPAHLDSPDGPFLASATGEMTMLVKLLACVSPLSLQTHPTKERAQAGFAREEALGIDRTAPTRMYRDDSDKPEMMIALEPFEALCGFARVDASVALLRSMGWDDEASYLAKHGIASYLSWAFDRPDTPLVTHAPQWLRTVAELYPNDKGLRVAPLLNHIVLQPGEAIALPAGNLHAYLRGTGLEVMKSSDNVVRAGFTSKHIDVSELLSIVDSTELPDPIVQPIRDGAWLHYSSPSPAFSVSAVDSALSPAIAPASGHRMIFGMFGASPSMVFLPSGESATLPINSGVFWVCTQNQ
jgi:mannose-6-phosphate isomerase